MRRIAGFICRPTQTLLADVRGVFPQTAFAGWERRLQVRFVIGSASLLAALALAGEAAGSPRGGSGHLPRNGLIAYESDVAGPLEIYVMNPDGSKKRRLTHSRHN